MSPATSIGLPKSGLPLGALGSLAAQGSIVVQTFYCDDNSLNSLAASYFKFLWPECPRFASVPRPPKLCEHDGGRYL